MAFVRNRTTGALTTLAQAKTAFPNISFGATLSVADYNTLNVDPVLESPRPTPTLLQAVQEVAPTQGSDGQWYRTYTLVDITAGLDASGLTALKQQLATTLSSQFSAKRDALIAAGFQYNFAAYTLTNGAAATTVTVNGTPGLLTLQMDSDSQINWLGLIQQAQLEIQNTPSGSTPANMWMRVAENVNVVVPPAQVITILAANGAWKAGLIQTCSGLKDTLTADVADPTKTPADVVAVVWPS